MASPKCILLRKSTPWKTAVLLLTFSVLIANFCGCGIFSISITTLALIISTIIFKFSKKIADQENVVVHQKGVLQDPTTLLHQIGETVKEFQDSRDDDDGKCCSSEVTEESSQVEELKTEAITTSHENNNVVQHGMHSESESIDPSFSSEDSDIDWPYSYSCNFGRSPEFSDDSISDEESMIEIAIPGGHFLSPKQDLKNFQNLSEKTFLDQQHKMVELFAEINDMYEEENLIEIDLSV